MLPVGPQYINFRRKTAFDFVSGSGGTVSSPVSVRFLIIQVRFACILQEHEIDITLM